MDADRFDAFVRSLPAISRRSALLGSLATGLAAVLFGGMTNGAEARKNHRRRKRRKKCKGGKKKCGKKCRDLRNDANNCGFCGNECPTGECLNGTCTCVDSTDCDECICVNRAEGGKACASAEQGLEECLNDLRCRALGGFCGETAPGVFTCTIPCPKKS